MWILSFWEGRPIFPCFFGIHFFDQLEGSGTKRQGLDWKAVDRVYTQFMNADANSSGTISFDEMVAVFKKVIPQLAANEYSTEFNKIDTNHSGHVDFMEYPREEEEKE